MLKKTILLSILALLVACGNSQKPAEQTEFEYVESAPSDDVDSLGADQVDKPIELPPPPRTPDTPDYDEEFDNMRGFDPASEDDMPDNGMSRYMENNDEEGWD